MSYRITTDSTCDLPREFYAERGIVCIPLSFRLDGLEFTEGAQGAPSASEFYNQLREGKSSTTMQINSFEFVQAIEPLLKQGNDVLHIAFSSGLSGTYESCERGAADLRERYPDRKILVIDTLSASMGEGLLTYYADENLKAGLTIEDNAAWIESHKLQLCHWFTVNDLMHLHRGGRVSKASAIVGSLLNIKPVLHVDNEGHLKLVSKCRGRAASLDALVQKLKETAHADIAEQMVFISHGDCLEDAEKLADKLRREAGVTKIQIHYVGAVIGTHSGPGTIALFFLGSER